MTLAEIIGNRDLVKALTGMVESGHIPHALLFYENDGCGAFALDTETTSVDPTRAELVGLSFSCAEGEIGRAHV